MIVRQVQEQYMPFAFASRARRAVEQPISYLMAHALANPQIISLAAGFVDPHTLPQGPMAAITEKLLQEDTAARAALQYGTTQGEGRFREQLYEHLAQLDGASPEAYPGSAEQVVVTTGSQQMLHLLAELLLDPDDIVFMSWPDYFVFTGTLGSTGAAMHCIEMDEQGLIPEQLDDRLAAIEKAGQLERVKMVYVQSCHQNPTGLTLAPQRHEALLDIVRRYSRRHRILLVEDAAYRELTYRPPGQAEAEEAEAPRVPAIKRHDQDNRFVALLQTFSKSFSPGLKTGYSLLPDDLVEPVIWAKGGHDFGSSHFCQAVLHEAMSNGMYDQHVRQLRRSYAVKRDVMLDALAGAFHGHADVRWTTPGGGLYVWLTLPEQVDTSRDGPLFHAAIEEGVLFVPGLYCYPPDPERTPPGHSIRLSFGVPTSDQIREGIGRLARAVRRVHAHAST